MCFAYNTEEKNISSCTVEKVFFVFYPHTLTFCCNRLTDSNKGCEGKCEGSFFYPHTYPHHFPSRPLFFRQECILLVTGIQWASRKQRYTGRIAMLHYRCNYAAHLVPDSCTFLTPFFCEFYLCCTIGIPMLYYRYTYAVLSVYLCWTFGTRMLYSSGTVFSICLQAISRRIKSSFFVLL